MCSSDLENAAAVADAITAAGGTAVAFRSDVSQLEDCLATVDAVASALGRPQVLVNSAGILGSSRSEEETAEQWRRILSVNLDGTFFMCRATLPHLLDGGGTIVNIASNAGFMGQPFSAAYCASKGGVVNLTRALAVEYIARGVRVNAVAPGIILSDGIAQYGDVLIAEGRKRIPAHRLGKIGRAHV